MEVQPDGENGHGLVARSDMEGTPYRRHYSNGLPRESPNGQSLKVQSVARALLGSGPIKIRRFLGKSDKRQASVRASRTLLVRGRARAG